MGLVKQTSHKWTNTAGFHFSEVPRVVKPREMENKMASARAAGTWKRDCLMAIESVFYEMKKF